MMPARLFKFGLCLLLLGWLDTAAALSTDRNQPMYVEADHADINDKTGLQVYTGHVTITQGSMHMTAEHLTLHTKDGKIQQAVALGQPATYKQRPDGKDQDIHGESLRMEYYADRDQLILIDKARVTQGGDIFRSEKIIYHISDNVVNAGTGKAQDRVRITIQPRNK